jgi:uncharacterized protein (TIGR00251 family)
MWRLLGQFGFGYQAFSFYPVSPLTRLAAAVVVTNIISVHVHPGASRSEVLGFSGGVLRIKVAAPPVRNKANKELIAFLSRILGVSQGALTIIHGRASKDKVLAIKGMSQEQIRQRLLPG